MARIRAMRYGRSIAGGNIASHGWTLSSFIDLSLASDPESGEKKRKLRKRTLTITRAMLL